MTTIGLRADHPVRLPLHVGTSATPPLHAVATTRLPRVQIWDMSSGTAQAMHGSDQLRRDPELVTAARNAHLVDTFFRTRFGRDGWDGRGTPWQVVVHAPNENGTPRMNNAYWDLQRKRIYLGDGDGRIFAPLGRALDVMVHEATHAVVDSSVKLKYEGVQGGLNESWADVLASVADQRNWLIGEDVLTPGVRGDAIRDLEHPTYASVSQLPTDRALDPYDYSGIPSLAAVRVANVVGRDEMGQIWYRALTHHLDDRAGFAGAARATLDAAADRHGASSSVVDAVLAAWRSVGVDPRWNGRAAA